MTEQQWNFAGIEAAASAIQGNVTSIHSLLDEGKQSLTKLAAAWGGSGSEAYQGVQQKWDATATELNNALQNLARTISEAGQAMASTGGISNSKFNPAGSWSCRGTGTLRPEPRFHSTCSTLSTSARSSNWPQRYPTISRGLDVVERTCCCCWSYRRGGNRCAACHHPGDDPDRQTDDRFGTASGGADGNLY